jgi:hypothetical protein
MSSVCEEDLIYEPSAAEAIDYVGLIRSRSTAAFERESWELPSASVKQTEGGASHRSKLLIKFDAPGSKRERTHEVGENSNRSDRGNKRAANIQPRSAAAVS